MPSDFDDYRMQHLVRTAQVWARLRELGATEADPISFDFSFEARSRQSVEALARALVDYSLTVSSQGVLKKRFTISGNSGPITWTEEQLIKWVDYLIQVGADADCVFDGCGAQSPGSAT